VFAAVWRGQCLPLSGEGSGGGVELANLLAL